MKKRIFALLLAFVMLIGALPVSAFATEATEPEIIPCETEGCTYAYGHEGECSNYVASEAPAAPAAVSTTAAEAEVYVSGAKNGRLCLVNQPVTVTDLNDDGLLSYDEAMIAAHEMYCPGGYISTEGAFGLQVGMLWGEGDGEFANALFYCNDEALQMNVGESYIGDGDRLYACMLKYSDIWGDVYTYFDKTEITVDTGKEFTLTLNGGSYFGSPIVYDQVQVGTWSEGTFTAFSDKAFDENGEVTLSFEQAGTYIVSAEGEYYDDYGSLTPVIPPYCVVTVNQAEVSVERVSLDKTEISIPAGSTETLTATVLPDNAADKTVTWTSSEEAVATVADGVITAVAAGTATITAKAGQKEATCTVTVTSAQTPGGGNGEDLDDGSVKITSQEELRTAITTGGTYQLSSDITLDNSWSAVNTSSGKPFILNGNGYSITLSGVPMLNSMVNAGDLIKNLIITGSVTRGGDVGPLAVSCYGSIRNCVSTADVGHTGYSWDGVGGFVGTIRGTGVITNCFSAAIVSNSKTEGYGGIAGNTAFGPGTISGCYVAGTDRIASSLDWSDNGTAAAVSGNTVLAADFDAAAVAAALTENAAEGDFGWSVVNGIPVPVASGGSSAPTPDATEEELAAMNTAVSDAEAVDTDTKIYTAESLTAFTAALASAREVAASDSPKQSAVTKATADLIAAQAALAERNIAPLDLNGQEVISITTADQLEYMQDGKYYRLDADITLGQYWFGYFNTMNSVLDGNGHTVTLTGKPLWSAIGTNGVVQNLGVLGTAQNSTNDTGAFAKDCEGLIVNCWSSVTVTSAGQNNKIKNTGGFAANLKSGGAIVNSYVSGNVSASGSTGEGKAGIFAGTAEANTMVKNGYWLNTVDGSVVGAGSGIVAGCATKDRTEFYSEEFLTLLNSGKGENGRTWTINDQGWPHLGAAGSYEPPKPIELAYTAYEGYGSGTTTFTDAKGLLLSIADVLPDPDAEITYYVGKFSYPDFNGEVVFDPQYEANGQGNHKVFVSAEGELQVVGAGSLEVAVCEKLSGDYQYGTELTRFVVTVRDIDAEDVRLIPSGEHVTENTDGTYTVAGSAQVFLNPEIKVDGTWRSAPSSLFTFEDTGALRRTGSSLYATEPGDMTVTASYQGKSGTVTITSTYVPVTSIAPAPNGTYVIHGRNANTAGSGQFLDLTLSHNAGTVVVAPENASYRDSWALTTSDPEIAYYGTSYMMAIVPVKAGTVTLTATSADPRLETPVTGTSTITLEYFNPLQKVEIAQTDLTVKENETITLPLTFTGAKDADGYHVSEPGMVWAFSGDGEVEITREPLGVIIGAEDSKEYCIANSEYKLTGAAPGTVTVTGTPVDQTGGAEPVTFTVEVTSGTPEIPADNDELVQEGMSGAWSYLGTGGQYEYGDEWIVFALSRSGKKLTEGQANHYVASVKEAYSNPGNAELKPTTIARVMLAVSVLGEDASDLAGIDLVELLCTSDNIRAGSNEPIWALIALDSMDYEVPGDAPWTREALITETLKYQNETTGAFGLTNKASASLDMTAMAVQALAPYYSSDAKAKAAMDAALAWLQNQMDRNCDFGSSESTAQVMIALTALGLDPLDEGNGFVKSVARNLITAMDSYRFADGGYKHYLTDMKSNSMATQQVLLALEAYRRFTANEDRLYDLNGNGETKYAITVTSAENGSVTVSKTSATEGETITITAAPSVGYALDTVKVIAASGTAVTVSRDKFTMPGSDVVVTVTFKRAENAVTAVEDAIAAARVEKANQKTLTALQALQDAYDALTEQEKARVSNAADLENLWDAFEEALDQHVEEKTDALNAYIEDLGKSNYTAEKWNEIEKIQADAIADFAKAGTTEAVDRLFAAAVLDLQNISYGNTITVSFTLLGDSEHGSNGALHTLADGSLTTWISTASYQLEAPATVFDLFQLAVAGKYSYVNSGNYISSINGLSEFDNGPNSGWKYTLNGAYPSLGVEQQYLKDGDKIVFHYTDDYTKENGSMGSQEDAEDQAEVQKVEELIDAIGTVSLNSKSKIDDARKAYDALTYAQKQLVDNYAALTAAESKYAQLKKDADEAAAKKVGDMIDDLDSSSAAFEADVKAAKAAYDALTADQKKLVDNYQKLANALKELASEEDKEAAEAVEKRIDAIGTVTAGSEAKIKAAREAYDKLTDEQKALVGNLAVLEAAEEKLAALKALAGIENIYKTTGDYLEKLGTPVPGAVGGEWVVIGLIRSGREIKDLDAYYEAAVQYVQENIDSSERMHSAKSTENSRMILALTAIGKDVTDVGGHNLLNGLNDMAYIQKQGINGPIWALLAFDSGNYPAKLGDVSREALIQVILDAQLPDGGWALSGSTSDADITGMALQALAPYYKTDAKVKAAVDEALETLSVMQTADGAFGSIDGVSAESIAQVVAGLSALGIDAHTDARFIKNGVSAIDALCAFYVEGGGFKHIPGGSLDGMATEQSYYALTAYFRMLDKKTALYDMTDVIDMGGDVVAEEPAETLPAETEPVPTQSVETPAEDSRSFPWWLLIVIVVLAGSLVVLLIISKPKKGRHVKK